MSDRHISDKELNELVPTLPIEEIFLIEFKKGNKWTQLVEFDGRNITCNLCSLKLFLPSLANHCTTAKHKANFMQVQRLYHPKRTQSKNKNEKLPEATIKQLFEKAKQKAVDFNKEAQRICDLTINKKIQKLCLTTNVRNPKQVYVTIGLPLTHLVQLEYLVKGVWKSLLTADHVTQNSKFCCQLCEVFCGGVITVGAHFGGNSHMNLQLKTQGVRHKIHKHLTKNCRVQFSNEYKITIHPRAKQIYKERAEKWLAEIDNLSDVHEELDALEDVETRASYDKKSNESSVTPSNKQKESVNSKALTITSTILERTDKSEPVTEPKEEGLIGVEYVAKLLRPHNGNDIYECVLCETVYTESKMQVHLVSHDHRLKYCDMHYGDTMKKYKDLVGHMRYNDFFCCMSPLLSKLALEIENVHSRALPSSVLETEFMNRRADFVGQIYAVKHACQGHGPSFSKVVSKEDIEAFKKNRHNFKEPTISSKPPCRFTITPKSPYLGLFIYNLDDRLDRTKTKEINKSSSRDGDRNREHEKRSRHRSKSPNKSLRASKREREQSIESPTTKMWKQYDKDIVMEKKKIDRQYDDYRKQPEGHPLYEQEWNRFWKQRRDELIAEGIDHRTYNYQAEWVHYFKNRLEELFCEAVRQVKDKVRPPSKMPIDSNYTQRLATVNPTSNKITRFSADPFGLQQIHQQQFQQQEHLQRLPSQASTSMSTVQVTPMIAKVPEPLAVQPIAIPVHKETSIVTDERPNVIHVLRLMTAMEDHLGSLGTKIMDLFTKALQLEKKSNNNATFLEKNLLNADSCNLLEVAMEKLRGVVYAGLLEGNKANSFNKIIKATEDLLNFAEMRGYRESSTEFSLPENSNRNNNNTTIDIQKFLNAIQNKSSAPATQQKSLSDTLMRADSTPERSPRSSKVDHFRNSSPPSYAYERTERNKSFNFEDHDIKPKLNLSVRVPNSHFHLSSKDIGSEFNVEKRGDMQEKFGASQRDIKPNFNIEERNFESNFNAPGRQRNMNMRDNSSSRHHSGPEFDDRNQTAKYSTST